MLKTFGKRQARFNALAKLVNNMDLPKRLILMNAFVMLNFIISPLFGCFIVVHLTTKITTYMSTV